MIDIVGWELDRALERLMAEGTPTVQVERVLPPRGEPYPSGVWRVVRTDLSRGRLTAALFPFAKERARSEGEEGASCPDSTSLNGR